MALVTLDDVDVDGRTVGLRIDVNSPLDGNGLIADDARFHAHRETIEELADRGARVVIMAHQGRPGGDDFTTLAAHARHLEDLLDRPVRYVDATFGTAARSAIDDLAPGEVLCLENVRFYSEEYLSLEPEAAAATHLVADLGEAFDLYVNDAFAVAHRSQPSVIGFPQRVPSAAGRVMEAELAVLDDIERTPAPRLAMLGGAKVADSLSVAERLLEEGLVECVLAGGLVANLCFAVGGHDPGPATEADLRDRSYESLFDRADGLWDRHGERIVLPTDVAVADGTGRAEVDVEDFPLTGEAVPRDVGSATVATWCERIEDVSTVICNGPVGRFEEPRFADGTKALFAAAATAETSIAGGGDTSAALRRFEVEGFDHVSTGGGASLQLLSGEPLPGVVALERCSIAAPS